MRGSLRFAGVLAAIVAVLATTPSASADAGPGDTPNGAGATSDDSGLTVGVSTGGGETSTGSGASGTQVTPPTCGLKFFNGDVIPSDDGSDGWWVIDTCKDPTDPAAIRWIPKRPGADPRASVAAAEALSRTPWPTIKVRLNPPPSRLLVNFPTWLHLDSGWQTVSATASVSGVSATVTARPEWVRWDMGEGGSVTCHSRGTAYDAARSWSQNLTARDCGYTYRRSSARAPSHRFTVTVTIHYAVMWSASGAAGGGSLGGHDVQTAGTVAVGQLQALAN